MAKKAIHTNKAPEALGPYSQAIAAGDLVFCSGQVPIDPATGVIVEGGVDVQSRRVLENLSAVLAAVGLTLDDVVKTTIFLSSMGDFQTVNGVYAEFFSDAPPARATIEVAALPLGALVEIEAVARR
jgi:2-iminobutanoate/2-iminopropanoate deaminase